MMDNVSLDFKIGQMVLSGFRGTVVGDTHPVMDDIRFRGLGSIILFDYDVARQSTSMNIESPHQLRVLTRSLQLAAAMPLLISIDQEGGTVNRLKAERGFPPSVSAQYLGTLNDLNMTREYAGITAEALSSLGINLNLAPCVDVNVNPDNPIIGKRERSYGAASGRVIAHARVVIEEHHRHGVLCAIKHFPGHGSSSRDTHLEFVDVTSTWRTDELEPYRALVADGLVDVVMTAHVFHGAFDPEKPATLSKRLITGVLREEIGFDGVVISDDMQMKAIRNHFGKEASILHALEAGVDILAFGNNLIEEHGIVQEVVSIIRKLVDSGKISASRIDESFTRISALRNKVAHARVQT